MRKAFTLVEMLVVVVVLVTLMGITFKLAGVGRDQQRRTMTITRMQKLENCLSGYYAAYGSYPPVPLHASQDPFLAVDDSNGQQRENAISGRLSENWESVRTACKAQPLAARYPFDPKYKKFIENISRIIVERASSSDSRYKAFSDRSRNLSGGFTIIENPNDVEGWDSKSYWQDVKIFQFGLMSYLLPRYLFMLQGVKQSASGESALASCLQWTDNNRQPANQDDGDPLTWEQLVNANGENTSLIQRIPSQAVTARWLPNLIGIVGSTKSLSFYGVNLNCGDAGGGLAVNIDNANIDICVSGNFRYVLDAATVNDGWGNEFFYASEPPYQSYRLWSSGPDGKTFPPWYPIENIENSEDRKTAANWMADDVMFMSN